MQEVFPGDFLMIGASFDQYSIVLRDGPLLLLLRGTELSDFVKKYPASKL